MAKALIIIAQNGYQDHEYAGTRSGLEGGDYEITVGSSAIGSCTGSMGGSEEATIALSDVNVDQFDLIAFVGGPGAAAYASDPEALRIANEAVRSDIKLGAICIAPTILAKAHVLEGRRATVWNGDGQQGDVLTQYGAEYTEEAVTIDGNIVTGNGPDAAEEFGRALGQL